MPLPPPAPTNYSPDRCAICLESLHIPSTSDGQSVPSSSYIIDDVQLLCGPPGSQQLLHHFHWNCIVEWAKEGGDYTRCPLCRQNTLDSSRRFIVNIRNEGGFEGGFDLGEEIDEEIYMDSHPQERHEQAFLMFMDQGDFDDAGTVLREHQVDINCAYRPGGQTAMHMAALNDDTKAVEWLSQHGANPNVKDDQGMTPLDAAKDCDSAGVIIMLSSLP